MTYYRRREHVPTAGYYGDRQDPDGVVRHQASDAEHARSIVDVRQEAAYLIGCKRVLDLGCGTGAIAHYTREAYGLGVDPDPDARAALIDRYPFAPAIDKIEHVAPDVKPFDGLISYHAIEHMTDPLNTVSRALRLCATDARVVISTPDFDSPSARKYGDRFRLLHDPTHISLFSTTGLVEMLRDLGVAIDRVVYPFRGTRWEAAAKEWVDTGSNFCAPAPGNIVSVYGWKR